MSAEPLRSRRSEPPNPSFHRRPDVTKLLVVETSPRGDYSISRTMSRRFVVDMGEQTMDGFIATVEPQIELAAAA